MVLELSLRRYRLGLDLSATDDKAFLEVCDSVFRPGLEGVLGRIDFQKNNLANPKGIEGNYD